jgi:hypothetical protein
MKTIGKILSKEPVMMGAFIDAGVTAIVVPMSDVAPETKTLILAFATAFIAWLVRVASVPAAAVEQKVQDATDAGITAGELLANQNLGLLAMAPAKKATPVKRAAKKA